MVEAVDQLIGKIRHKSVWDIVDFCIEIWAKKFPTEHKKFLEEMKRFRANRKNQYGATESRSLRNLLSVPPEVTYLLYKIASHKIEDYGTTKFWRDFAKRYPAFRGGDKF